MLPQPRPSDQRSVPRARWLVSRQEEPSTPPSRLRAHRNVTAPTGHMAPARRPSPGPAPGTSRRRTLLASSTWPPALGTRPLGRRTAAEFTAFLQAPPDACPTVPAVAAICEDDSVHNAKAVTGGPTGHDHIRSAMETYTVGTVADRPSHPHQVHAFFRHRSPARMPTTAAPWTRPGHRRIARTTSASSPASQQLRYEWRRPSARTPSAPYRGPESRSRWAHHRPRPGRGGTPCRRAGAVAVRPPAEQLRCRQKGLGIAAIACDRCRHQQ